MTFMKDQLQIDIVQVVEKHSEGEGGRVHYILHRVVIRTDKSTTKLRVVYDASAKSDGVALSDCVCTGPPLAENIFDILLSGCGRGVSDGGNDGGRQSLVKIPMGGSRRQGLSRNGGSEVYSCCIWSVSSPFLLNATIKHYIEQCKKEDPEFMEKFLCSIYVADSSSGAPEIDTAYALHLRSMLRLAE